MLNEQSYTGLVVADMHAGSLSAPWPEGILGPGGTIHEPTDVQRTLNKYFDNIVQVIPKLDFVLHLGDCIDGTSIKENGYYTVTTHTPTQRAAYLALMKLIDQKCSPTTEKYSVMGTEFHEFLNEVDDLARDLRCVQDADGFYARPHLTLNIDGVVIEAWHKLGNTLQYKAQAIEREMFNDIIAGMKKGYTTDLMIWAHWHQFLALEAHGKVGITAPSMKSTTPYEKKRAPNRFIPDVGMLLIYVCPDRKRRGLRCVEWECLSFPTDIFERRRVAKFRGQTGSNPA